MKALCGGLLAIGLMITQVSGCGLSLGVPVNHFDGVEEHGYANYWAKMGEVALNDKTSMTVSFSFNSHQEAVSPYLGKGWSIPFLEAHVEPLSEDSFEILMPDGLLYDFGRTSPGSDTYSGSRGWMAQTNGETLTTWAPCGWKIIFEKGKIQQIITPENKFIEYHYNGPVAMEVVEDGKILAKAESMGGAGITDLLIGNLKIALTLAKRPIVFTKLTENLIIGFDQSLNTLQWPDGKKETYVFGIDKVVNPTLTIAFSDETKRSFTWDSTTRQIKSDGEWIYNFDITHPLAVNRTNAKGQSEGYEIDGADTITHRLDGVTDITTRFVNAGKLDGHIRSITQIKDGISTTLRRYDYDEKGRTTRAIILINNKPHDITFKYNDSGKESEIDMDGKLYITKQYDAQGRLIGKILADGIKMGYSYANNGIKKTTYLKNGKIIVQNLNDKYQEVKDLVIGSEKTAEIQN